MKNVSKKAILVISFGTSYDDTRNNTIGAIEEDIKKAYPNYEVRRAFTSKIILAKLKKRDDLQIANITQAMENLIKDKFETVICQPTYIMNGYEYYDMIKEINIFKDKFKSLQFGTPLLTSTQDYYNMVDAVNKEIPKLDFDDALLLVGHGTKHFANSSYAALDYQFKDNGNKNIFVGTIENYPNLNTVLKQIKALNFKKIYLMPLMIAAGEHAINDIAGDNPTSWKTIFENEGFEVKLILKGLGEYQSIRKIYIERIKMLVNC